LAAGSAVALTAGLPAWPGRAEAAAHRLVAGSGRAHLVGGSHPQTAVWAYNDRVPGPAIRVRQGERLRITVDNRLAEETTVHWHGLRV
jgi:FtsP/CotA-like multicopper oxidase with cupredoxin domain